MIKNTFQEFLEEEKKQIDIRIPQYIEELKAPQVLKDSMVYSLKAGGKRLRPILLLATLNGYGKSTSIGYDVACAIEMIHTYSLVHDDLPAMDDDDLRRGKATNHKVFGQANAILAGDALLTLGFQLVSSIHHVSDERKIKLIQCISKAAGAEGMVCGQVEDILGETKSLTLEELEFIHHHKTGALLSASVVSGAILAGVDEREIDLLTDFAKHLGIAFQIKDDILDVEGTEEEIGKPVGSDEDMEKSTYPRILGMDQTKEKLDHHIEKAKRFLYKTNMDHGILVELTEYIATRGK